MKITPPLLTVSHLSKRFDDPATLFRHRHFYALNRVSFELAPRQTLAIIGRNGSGKSTIAKLLVGLTEEDEGDIFFQGKKLTFGDYAFRSRHIRMLFQNADEVLNPRLNVGQILDTPLTLLTDLNQQERDEKIGETLRLVGLYPDHANLRISTMSSSQKQRIALARALILNPEIIIIDDAIANLDSSVKIQLMNVLLKIQKRLGTSYLYIGQHLGIIKHIADQVLVLDEGKVVEYGETKTLFTQPQQEITKRLLEGEFGQVLDESAWVS